MKIHYSLLRPARLPALLVTGVLVAGDNQSLSLRMGLLYPTARARSASSSLKKFQAILKAAGFSALSLPVQVRVNVWYGILCPSALLQPQLSPSGCCLPSELSRRRRKPGRAETAKRTDERRSCQNIDIPSPQISWCLSTLYRSTSRHL
jgi:hypothetical protein